MKNLTKLVLISVFALSLTGCFGETTDTGGTIGTAAPGKILYETNDFAVEIPDDWEIVESGDFTYNVPSDTIVAFRNNIKSEIFTANVNVSKVLISEEDLSAEDFAKSSKSKVKNSLLSFKEFEGSGVGGTILIGDIEVATHYLAFQGKKDSPDPIVNFGQLYTVYNGIGYTITGSHLPEEDETIVNYVDQMLNSFALN